MTIHCSKKLLLFRLMCCGVIRNTNVTNVWLI